MTAAEAEAFLSDKSVQNRDTDDRLERMETQHEGRKLGQAIEDDVASVLVGLPGQTEDSARAEAVLWRERILQRARDRGMDPDALWAEERPGFLGPRTLPSAGDVDSMLAALHSDQTARVSARQVLTVRAALDARGITPEQASRDDVLKERWPRKMGQDDKLIPTERRTGFDGQGYKEAVFGRVQVEGCA